MSLSVRFIVSLIKFWILPNSPVETKDVRNSSLTIKHASTMRCALIDPSSVLVEPISSKVRLVSMLCVVTLSLKNARAVRLTSGILIGGPTTVSLLIRNWFMRRETLERNSRKPSVSAAPRGILSTRIEAPLTTTSRSMAPREASPHAITVGSRCFRKTKSTGDAWNTATMIYATSACTLSKSEWEQSNTCNYTLISLLDY